MKFRLALFGAPPDTPNMGVSALYASAVEGLTRELGEVEWVIFDNGLGRRSGTFMMSDGVSLPLTLFGARVGRRYHRQENMATMQIMSRLGKLGALLNVGVRLIDSSDAVLDVSGGDSFSDIYGWKRFSGVYWPKKIALMRGKPLILMPQTYGPYRAGHVWGLAKSITRGAAMAWARDPNSYEVMKRLLGPDFDPARHREGVDMAFGLSPRSVASLASAGLAAWLAESPRTVPLVGINVSGLIFNNPAQARLNYRLIANYRTVVTGLVTRLLERTSARIVLISHVMDQPGHYESDIEACQNVASAVQQLSADRVLVAPIDFDQSEAKWLISHMDWFCGTRMHSTIASLSSGVPTAAVAYSDKTLGVFDSCGQAAQVLDPRTLETDAVIDGLWRSFLNRDSLRQSLMEHLPRVRGLAVEQMHDIAECIRKAVVMAKDL